MEAKAMHVYRVGDHYNPRLRCLTPGANYNFRAGGHELYMALPAVQDAEIDAVARGRVDLALFTTGDQIFLLYALPGEFSWSDAPYTWWRVPTPQRSLPPSPPDASTNLVILLVEQTSGIIRAVREARLPSNFADQLHSAIRRQATRPFDEVRYELHLCEVRRRYPSAAQMVNPAQARCTIPATSSAAVQVAHPAPPWEPRGWHHDPEAMVAWLVVSG